jgi:hypothetical protein
MPGQGVERRNRRQILPRIRSIAPISARYTSATSVMVMPYFTQVRMRGDARKMRSWNRGLPLRLGAERDFDVLEPNRWWRDYLEHTRFTRRQVS